jgi:hypothetical protein
MDDTLDDNVEFTLSDDTAKGDLADMKLSVFRDMSPCSRSLHVPIRQFLEAAAAVCCL